MRNALKVIVLLFGFPIAAIAQSQMIPPGPYGSSGGSSSGGGSTSPGGSNTQVQFNNGGSFGGASNFFYNNGTVGIGIGTPATSSVFDVVSTSSGSLPAPQVSSTTMLGIVSPADGLLIYNTTEESYYYYNNSATVWQFLGQGKQYVIGTAYTNGTPALSCINPSGETWTTTRGVMVPYQTSDGTWRMRFNFRGTMSGAQSDNSYVLSLNGVTFKNVSNYYQAITINFEALQGATVTFSGSVAFNSGHFIMITTTSHSADGTYGLSGDVELDSKPTWAD